MNHHITKVWISSEPVFLRKVSLNIFLQVVAVLSLSGCASLLVNAGIAQKRGPAVMRRDFVRNSTRWEELVPGIMPWEDSLKAAGIMKDTFIVREGCRLHAAYAPAQVPSANTAIVVHGYSAAPENIMMLVRMYRDSLGFNVLAPTLRHHGLSGGDYVQFGWNDRLDVLAWSAIAHEEFRDTAQVLHGVSMGAATVMMASGEDTPEYVRGFVEDCGYTNVRDEFIYAFDHYLHRDSLLVDRVAEICLRRFGLDFNAASAERQLARSSKPMLFIHGSGDRLVPPYMMERNYSAKRKGYKEFWIAPGSAHSRAYPDYPAEYTEKVRAFIFRHVLGESSVHTNEFAPAK